MERRGFNWQIWAALIVSAAGLFSFPLFFVRWPATRDVPWANFLLFGAAGVLLVSGLRRAIAPGRLRALRILVGAAVGIASATIFGFFLFARFVMAAALPASAHAPSPGQHAPAFTLPDEHGRNVSLSTLLTTPIPGSSGPRAPKGVLLVFYMYSGCRACNSEFHGLQQNLGRLADLGIRPVAISIDTPDVSRALSDEAHYTFTFLSDPGMTAIRQYDVADQDEGARPAEFLIDASGVVRWRYLTSNLYVRAGIGQILEAAKALP